jgi:hypothetical protein
MKRLPYMYVPILGTSKRIGFKPKSAEVLLFVHLCCCQSGLSSFIRLVLIEKTLAQRRQCPHMHFPRKAQ